MEDIAYSVAEVAKLLKVDQITVRRMIRDGKLAHFRFGRRVLVSAATIRQIIGG